MVCKTNAAQKEPEQECPLGPALLFPVWGLKEAWDPQSVLSLPCFWLSQPTWEPGSPGTQWPAPKCLCTFRKNIFQADSPNSLGCSKARRAAPCLPAKAVPLALWKRLHPGELRHQLTSRVFSTWKLLYSCGFRSWTLERMVVKCRLWPRRREQGWLGVWGHLWLTDPTVQAHPFRAPELAI